MFHEIYDNWYYEPDILTYPIKNPLQQNFFLPFRNTTCCCALAGTISCYYCNTNRRSKTTTKFESDDINDQIFINR